MHPYAKDYVITNTLVQDDRDAAKRDIFGNATNNVKYAEEVAPLMRSLGHEVELIFSSQKEMLANINMDVLQEEVDHQKKNNLPAFDNANARKVYWQQWKNKNALFLAESLGIGGGPLESKFLTGVFVTPSTSKHMFPTTKEMVQAN